MAERMVSRSRVIAAPPEAIFAVVASPAGHAAIDGSGSVRAAVSGPDPLVLGSRFRMDMKMGVPYKISSKVVEYEKDRLIAWAHLGRHRWRFELEPVDGGTNVTHTFDWSTAISPRLI
ncbi:MAG: SRPBCC family protein, partial [Acidimicrobiales bacterium]